MSLSENVSASYGGDAVARMAEYYAGAAVEIEDAPSGDGEPAEAPARLGTVTNDGASQPGGVAFSPATDAPIADAGTAEPVASDGDKPFRVFADEKEYREHIAAETNRARAAQSASDAEVARQRAVVADLERQIAAHERTRNELYTRAQTEEVTPGVVVETFTRRDNETRAEFAERQRAAEAESRAEAQRGERETLAAKGSEAAAETLLLRRALSLTGELGDIKGLDVVTALKQAVLDSPEAQRFAALSYSAPDADSRQWASEQAYRIGMERVREQGAAIKAALVPAAPPPAPAVSIAAPATLGREVPRYADRMDALNAAYGGTR